MGILMSELQTLNKIKQKRQNSFHSLQKKKDKIVLTKKRLQLFFKLHNYHSFNNGLY